MVAARGRAAFVRISPLGRVSAKVESGVDIRAHLASVPRVHRRLSRLRTLSPNEKRLSCAAVLCCSQNQFYYDGRPPLQPLVRRSEEHTEPSLYPHGCTRMI